MPSALPSPAQFPKLLEAILAAEPGTVYLFDLVHKRFLYLSNSYLDSISHTENTLDDPLAYLIHPDDLPAIHHNHELWSHDNSDQMRHIEYRSGSAKLNRSDKCIIGVLCCGKKAVEGDQYEQIIRATDTSRIQR